MTQDRKHYTRLFNILNGGRGDTTRPKESYTARDRAMADFCTTGMFIWNGKSPGTKAAFDYMAAQGKQCYLADFSKKPMKLTVANAKPAPAPEPIPQQLSLL